MQYQEFATYDSTPDDNGIYKKDKLLANKRMNEMLVLKDRYRTTMSQQDKDRLSEEYDKLYEYNYQINRVNAEHEYNFLNLTLREIINNLAMTLIKILDELQQQPFDIDIFTREDRLIYVGITTVIVAVLLFFVFNSS